MQILVLMLYSGADGETDVVVLMLMLVCQCWWSCVVLLDVGMLLMACRCWYADADDCAEDVDVVVDSDRRQ